jgi:hypothetical protein
MKMSLHFIPHQEGKYHGLSKPYARNVDLVEKVDGHRHRPRSVVSFFFDMLFVVHNFALSICVVIQFWFVVT